MCGERRARRKLWTRISNELTDNFAVFESLSSHPVTACHADRITFHSTLEFVRLFSSLLLLFLLLLHWIRGKKAGQGQQTGSVINL